MSDAADTLVGFTPGDAVRIGDAVRFVERLPGNSPKGRRQAVSPLPRLLIRGKLDAQLNGNATAAVKMSVWYVKDGTDVASSEKIDVWPWLIKSTQNVASGKMIVAFLDVASGRYYILGAECA